jgi:hypothetical protein
LSRLILPCAFPLQEEPSNLHYKDSSFPWDPPYLDDDDDEDSLVGTEGNPNYYLPLASNLSLQEDFDVANESVDESDELVDDGSKPSNALTFGWKLLYPVSNVPLLILSQFILQKSLCSAF